MTGPNLAEAAAGYAAQGVPVFPLRPGHKRPRTEHGVLDATTDAATVAAWWQRWPDANIGAACGVVFDVVDVDGPEAAAELDALYPEGWPATAARVRTPRPGGLHLYLPVLGAPSKAKHRGTNLDTRGAGGYVVLPPSRLVADEGQHAGAYTWEARPETFGVPDVATLAAARPWRRVWEAPPPAAAPSQPRASWTPSGGTTPYGAKALADEAATVAAAPVGGRNDALNRAAFKVGQLVPHEVTEADARAALLEAARACGLAETEARATLASGLGTGIGQPRGRAERDQLAGLHPGQVTRNASPGPERPDPTTGEVVGNFPTAAEVGSDFPSESEEKKSAAARLVDLALERYRFGVTPEGEAFGVPLGGGHVVRLLRGSRTSLRAELAAAYRRTTGRIASQQALADALLVLEGEAQEAEPETVHLRVAEAEGALWLDLGDAAETVVHVAGGQWRVVTEGVPVLFRRSALTGALPMPVPGDLAELWGLLNVAAEDRPLVLGWLVAALGAPNVPHPILALFGEQGTGKSTASKLLVDLVDPSPVPLRKPPRDMDSWVTAAAGSWVVGLDNLSTVPEWLSDTLCRAATGDGDVRRQLYTDSGLAVFAFRRVILLNGIDLGGLRGDLTERLLAIRLEAIPDSQRQAERAMTQAWEDARPRLLGGLLGEVARMASQLPYVRLGTSPRMADFAAVLAALDGPEASTGLDRYLDQARSLSADSLTADPFITRMMNTITDVFEGHAAELLALVTPDERPPRGWPTTARQVTTSLRRNAPALRKQGWTVDDLGSGNKANSTLWRVGAPEIAGKPSSPNSPNSPSPVVGELASQASHEYEQSQDECPLHTDTPQPDGCYTCAALAGRGWDS